jgi:hypothetical protein
MPSVIVKTNEPGKYFLQICSVENISKKGPLTADLSTPLRSGRDDKGEGRYGPQ